MCFCRQLLRSFELNIVTLSHMTRLPLTMQSVQHLWYFVKYPYYLFKKKHLLADNKERVSLGMILTLHFGSFD